MVNLKAYTLTVTYADENKETFDFSGNYDAALLNFIFRILQPNVTKCTIRSFTFEGHVCRKVATFDRG